MSKQRTSLISVVFTAICACAIIVIVASVPGQPLQRTDGGIANIRWRDLSEINRSTTAFQTGEDLRYVIAWNDLPCAELRTRLRSIQLHGRERLVLEYEGRTSAVIDWAWRYRLRGVTWFDPRSLLPEYTYRFSSENDDVERSWTVFRRFNRSVTATKVETDEPAPDLEVEHLSFRHGLDVPAAFLFVRSLGLDAPGRQTLEVIHEDDIFGIEAVVSGSDEVEVPAGNFKAVMVELSLRSLTSGKERGDSEEKPFGPVRLWLTASGGVPVRIEVETFVGRVSCELTGIENPAPETSTVIDRRPSPPR